MNRKQGRGLALVLGLALLTLSGCDEAQSGTIDYVDGHWVFTDAQTAQGADITQLLTDPDAFYGAASAMTDAELQQSFDRLSSVQCAEIFRGLGEERAMALAGRLTQTQVDRLLTILQGQENVRELTDAASLAAVWPTLTTDEQLSALSALSAEEYAALWSLLGSGETVSPEPEITPEPTAAPDMTDPACLVGIWHTLSEEEQSDILGRLTSAQFVTLWGLLNEKATPVPAQESAENDEPVAAAPEESDMPVMASDAAQTGEPEAEQTTPTPETPEDDAPEETPDAASMAETWYAMTPEEQFELVKQLTTEEFVALQELLSVHPKPTPAEEDELFIPTPKPTATRTPAPTRTPTPEASEEDPAEAPEGEKEEPDWSDPVYLAGIWHTLTPEEQLSILSTLTLEQYVELQALLARLPEATPQEPDVADADDRPAKGNTPSMEQPGTPEDNRPQEAADEEQTPGEAAERPAPPAAEGTSDLEDTAPQGGSVTPDGTGSTLSDAILRARGEATPSELSAGGTPGADGEPLALLSRILRTGTENTDAGD